MTHALFVVQALSNTKGQILFGPLDQEDAASLFLHLQEAIANRPDNDFEFHLQELVDPRNLPMNSGDDGD